MGFSDDPNLRTDHGDRCPQQGGMMSLFSRDDQHPRTVSKRWERIISRPLEKISGSAWKMRDKRIDPYCIWKK